MIGKTERGFTASEEGDKGTKLMMADGLGIPLGIGLDPAPPHEAILIRPSLTWVSVTRNRSDRLRHRVHPLTAARETFLHLIYDGAIDSDPASERLAKQGINLICIHHKN